MHHFFEEKIVKIKEEGLYSLIKYILVAAVIFVLAFLVIIDNRFYYVYQSFCKVPNIFWVVLYFLGFGIYFVLKKKKVIKFNFVEKEKNISDETSELEQKLYRRNMLIVSVVFLAVQIIVAWQIYFKTGWDCGELVQMAQRVAFGYEDIGTEAYFSMYPNNVLLVGIFAAVLRFVKFLGFHADYFPLIMIGCLCVNMAGYLLADCVRKLTGRNKMAQLSWVIYALLVGLSPWISIPYSDTYSILFPIFCLWLYLRKDEKPTFIIWGGIGFLAYLGSYIKPTVILILVVFVILEGWHILCEFKEQQSNKHFWKKLLLGVAAVTVGIVLAWSFNKVAEHKMNYTPIEEAQFTPFHYLMMGMNVESGGTYDQRDVNFSASAATVAERNSNALQVCRERLTAMGIKGTAIHYWRKLMTNFNDGTFAWGNEGEFYWNIPEKNNGIATALRNYYYESGVNYPLFQIIAQGLWMLVLFLIPFVLFSGRKETSGNYAAIYLGILAIMCFVMVFEARARYLYLYSPLFILAAAIGFERFVEWTERVCNKA